MYQVSFVKIKQEHNKQQCFLKFTTTTSKHFL